MDHSNRKPGDYRRSASRDAFSDTRELEKINRRPGDYRRIRSSDSRDDTKRINRPSEKNVRSESYSRSTVDRRRSRSGSTEYRSQRDRRSEQEMEDMRALKAYQAALARQEERKKKREAEQKKTVLERERQKQRKKTARQSNSSDIDTMKPPKKRKKKSKWKKRLILTVFLILLVLLAVGFCLIYFNLNKDLSDDSVLFRYGISREAADFAKDHRIVNVAVFGVDAREDVEGSRSDAIMIASADYEHDSLKVSSLMRDTLIYCDPEETFDKLNAAYSLGEAAGALRTINENFDLAITDYVTIDFTAMVEMVNIVGGVTINIESEDELYWLNEFLNDVNAKVKTDSPHVQGTGEQLLDGSQALAYCRIRYVGNGDFGRTQRQRNVFEQVIQKAMGVNIFKKIELVRSVMPFIETTLTEEEIIKYCINLLFMSDHSIKQISVPVSDSLLEGYYGDMAVLYPNTLVDNIKKLYQFIFEADYTPSSQAQEISNALKQFLW